MTAHALPDVSTAALLEELRRRDESSTRPSCGSVASGQTYNTPLHVFALFLILVLSTLGKLEATSSTACLILLTIRQHVPFPSSYADSLAYQSLTTLSSCHGTSAQESS